ncbi:LamG-like jellyroll fold domain-containing protein, partial [Enterobacter hormaechei]
SKYANFDLINGVVDGTCYAYSIQKLANGWWRCNATALIEGDMTSASISNAAWLGLIDNMSDGRRPFVTGTIGDGIYVWGAHAEPLSITTSYIPTNGAAATRSTDDCTLQRSGNDNYFGSVTIAAEMQCNGKTLADGQTGSRRGILAIYPTTNDYCLVFVNSATNAAGVVTFSYGDPGQKANNEIIDDGKPHIVSVRSNGLQKDICIDGSLSGSATVTKPIPGNVASYSNIIMIGRGAGSPTPGQRMLNGHIRNLRIWHRALSDIQIKGLR